MRKIALATLFALALVVAGSSAPVVGAEQVDWQKIDAEWEAAAKRKTKGIANIQRDFVDGLCQDKKKTESVKKKCVAEFREIMTRRAKERTLFEKMIEANKLPPAERDKRGNELFVEHTNMNEETTRRLNRAIEEFK